jgi:hypothetical protein
VLRFQCSAGCRAACPFFDLSGIPAFSGLCMAAPLCSRAWAYTVLFFAMGIFFFFLVFFFFGGGGLWQAGTRRV